VRRAQRSQREDCIIEKNFGTTQKTAIIERIEERERTAEGTHAQYVDQPCSISKNRKIRLLWSINTLRSLLAAICVALQSRQVDRWLRGLPTLGSWWRSK
jgi:hypothetical protein